MKGLVQSIKRKVFQYVLIAVLIGGLQACSDYCSNQVEDIHISSPGRNTLKIQIDVHTTDILDVYVKYWPKGNEKESFISTVSSQSKSHKLVLTNLKPKLEYEFQVIAGNKNCSADSKVYSFATTDYPMWMKDVFNVICPDTTVLPQSFQQGYIMLYRRENPGILFFLNAKGDIVWYHQVNGTGFKTAHFTKNNSIISILGSESYPTSYGNEILELSLTGDTIFHIRKGEKDFKQTIHHEVLLNDKDQVVTICSEERTLDLSARGGGKADTVKSDGILVLDKQGRQVWKWTVFDTLNPLNDKNIVNEKNDWMHANSLNFDKDGNYLLSFYNNGQIWKIDAKTGKVIWKFGNGGDFEMTAEAVFDNSHAVHINPQNSLMLFDNGTSRQLSRSMAFRLDENEKKATLVSSTPLPRDVYSERMGSAYLVNDTAILHSCSKRNSVVLTNLKGTFLWALKTGFMPYRVEFIPGDGVKRYF